MLNLMLNLILNLMLNLMLNVKVKTHKVFSLHVEPIPVKIAPLHYAALYFLVATLDAVLLQVAKVVQAHA